jgi:hypothetical protein
MACDIKDLKIAFEEYSRPFFGDAIEAFLEAAI